MECIACYSRNIVRYGYYKIYQKFKCNRCNKQFSERSFSFFFRHRYPEEVIRNSILYTLFVSTRIAKFLVNETINFLVSHVSISKWIKKFAHIMINNKRTLNVSNVWHVDEKFIKVKGIEDFAYLWAILDDKNNMIAVNVSERRDISGAQTVLEIAKNRTKKPPDIIVTDGLQSYKKAIKKVFGRKVKHIQAHFESKKFMHKGKYYILSNNRMESLNSKINLWYKKFRGFKDIGTANLWCNLWMNFHNIMRPNVIDHKIISIHQIIK